MSVRVNISQVLVFVARPRFPRSLSRWRLFSRLCSREKRKNLENASSAELATLVRDMVGSRAGIVHASLPKDDPVRRRRSSVVSDPWHGIYWYLS